MRSLRALNSRPSDIIKKVTILRILEEITFNNYVTKTYLIRRLRSRHDIITRYLDELEKRGIVRSIKSFKITLYTLEERSREALLIKEFIMKWASHTTSNTYEETP